MTIITSKANPLVKKTKKLLQKKYRKESYLIEGWHLYDEAVRAQATILKTFVLEDYQNRVQAKENVYLVNSSVLKELSDTKTPQGVVAEIAISKSDVKPDKKGRYLVLEDVQDPGNLGTMVRTADAAALDAVIISSKSADLYNQKTLRSMQGSHFHLPVYRTDVLTFIEKCNQMGLATLATNLSRNSMAYRDLPQKAPFALIMGNEGNGISHEMTKLAQTSTHIPMPGQAESLNVAVAAGIVLFYLL